jgi:hypothetical protein
VYCKVELQNLTRMSGEGERREIIGKEREITIIYRE